MEWTGRDDVEYEWWEWWPGEACTGSEDVDMEWLGGEWYDELWRGSDVVEWCRGAEATEDDRDRLRPEGSCWDWLRLRD